MDLFYEKDNVRFMAPHIDRTHSLLEMRTTVTRTDSHHKLRKGKKGGSQENLRSPIPEKVKDLIQVNKVPEEIRKTLHWVSSIAQNEQELFILLHTHLPRRYASTLIGHKDLKTFQALPPYTVTPTPDLENTLLGDVARLFSYGSPIEELNNRPFTINGKTFNTDGHTHLDSVIQVLDRLKSEGFHPEKESHEETAKQLLGERHSHITWLFQAVTFGAPGIALNILGPGEQGFSIIQGHKLPHICIFSEKQFSIIHKRKLSFSKNDAPPAEAYVIYTFKNRTWSNTLFVTKIPKSHRKNFKILKKRIESSALPAPTDFLIKPADARSLKNLIELISQLHTKMHISDINASLINEFTQLKFKTPDRFYILWKSLIPDYQLKQAIMAFDSRESHLTLTEFYCMEKIGKHSPKEFLESDHWIVPFFPPLLDKLNAVLKPEEASEKSIRSFTIREASTSWIASKSLVFYKDKKEATNQ